MCSWPQQYDGSLLGRLQQREWRGTFGELDGNDAPTGGALTFEPAVLAGVEPVDARPAVMAKRVPDGERLAIVSAAWHRHTGAHGVAGAKECAEVRLVGDPKRRDDQVIPTAMPSAAPTAVQILSAELGGAQRAKATGLSNLIRWRSFTAAPNHLDCVANSTEASSSRANAVRGEIASYPRRTCVSVVSQSARSGAGGCVAMHLSNGRCAAMRGSATAVIDRAAQI